MAHVPTSPPASRNPVVIPRQLEQPQNVVGLWFQLFSNILGKAQLIEKLCNTLYLVLGNEEPIEARIRVSLPEKSTQRVQRRKVRTDKEFILISQLYEFEIKDVMLDLGSYVNILPKNTYEALGKPRLTYSPIQLRMENQYCIFPIGRLENVEIDVAGVKTVDDFEVIEIMGDKDPYPALLGIDWAYDNYAVIDLKKYTMTFEVDGIKVVQPLDPYLGSRYTEPIDNNMEGEDLDQLYTVITGTRNDYINPTANGSVSWRSIQSVDEDSELDFDIWKQGSHKRFSRICAVVRVTRWVGTKVREHPVYDGTLYLEIVLHKMEEDVREYQRMSILDVAFQNNPTRWWANH
jgi:hypothetical protein